MSLTKTTESVAMVSMYRLCLCGDSPAMGRNGRSAAPHWHRPPATEAGFRSAVKATLAPIAGGLR